MDGKAQPKRVETKPFGIPAVRPSAPPPRPSHPGLSWGELNEPKSVAR